MQLFHISRCWLIFLSFVLVPSVLSLPSPTSSSPVPSPSQPGSPAPTLQRRAAPALLLPALSRLGPGFGGTMSRGGGLTLKDLLGKHTSSSARNGRIGSNSGIRKTQSSGLKQTAKQRKLRAEHARKLAKLWTTVRALRAAHSAFEHLGKLANHGGVRKDDWGLGSHGYAHGGHALTGGYLHHTHQEDHHTHANPSHAGHEHQDNRHGAGSHYDGQHHEPNDHHSAHGHEEEHHEHEEDGHPIPILNFLD